MKRHIFFINEMEKLNSKKDSSLMLALTLKKLGQSVCLLFETDFYFTNFKKAQFSFWDFDGNFEENGCYLSSFNLLNNLKSTFLEGDTVHMRIDPPFDTRYMRYLWMLKAFTATGIKVVNSPEGILLNNEKIMAYQRGEESIASFIGQTDEMFLKFIEEMENKNVQDIILKPLDLFQGFGVRKVSLKNKKETLAHFRESVAESMGPIVAQPFQKIVESGEVRSVYFKEKELGSILKVPKSGEFLANIAQGASYQPIELSKEQKRISSEVCRELAKQNVPWVAFDFLGDKVSEINITCPGLLVEVSSAHKRNLAKVIAENL